MVPQWDSHDGCAYTKVFSLKTTYDHLWLGNKGSRPPQSHRLLGYKALHIPGTSAAVNCRRFVEELRMTSFLRSSAHSFAAVPSAACRYSTAVLSFAALTLEQVERLCHRYAVH